MLTSDPCELLFGLVASICGYKPASRKLAGVLHSVQYVAQLKATPAEQRGFAIAESRGQLYAHNTNQQQPDRWNDGSALAADGGAAALAARLAKDGARADQHAKPDRGQGLRTIAGYK